MFSWKNIKTTIRQKVVNSENNTEKVLGVAEAVGKTIVLGASTVAKVTPHIISDLMDTVIQNSDDDNKKAQAQDIKNQMKDRIKENNKTSISQDNELSALQKYVKKLESIQEQIKNYEKTEKINDRKMAEIFLKLETASEDEKITLNTYKEKLFDTIKKEHTQYMKLIAKENQLNRLIDDYKDNN